MAQKAFWVGPKQNLQGTSSHKPLRSRLVITRLVWLKRHLGRAKMKSPVITRLVWLKKSFLVGPKPNIQGTSSHEPLRSRLVITRLVWLEKRYG
jgi:hypothetical protein